MTDLEQLIATLKEEAQGYSAGTMFEAPIGEMNRASLKVTRDHIRELEALLAVRAVAHPFTYPRDREGFALCHHGRRIACDECVAEEEAATLLSRQEATPRP